MNTLEILGVNGALVALWGPARRYCSPALTVIPVLVAVESVLEELARQARRAASRREGSSWRCAPCRLRRARRAAVCGIGDLVSLSVMARVMHDLDAAGARTVRHRPYTRLIQSSMPIRELRRVVAPVEDAHVRAMREVVRHDRLLPVCTRAPPRRRRAARAARVACAPAGAELRVVVPRYTCSAPRRPRRHRVEDRPERAARSRRARARARRRGRSRARARRRATRTRAHLCAAGLGVVESVARVVAEHQLGPEAHSSVSTSDGSSSRKSASRSIAAAPSCARARDAHASAARARGRVAARAARTATGGGAASAAAQPCARRRSTSAGCIVPESHGLARDARPSRSRTARRT